MAATNELAGLADALLERKQQIALVVGKFGETGGIVTLEDLVETLVGEEIVDKCSRPVSSVAGSPMGVVDALFV